jgi:hypothetical protein
MHTVEEGLALRVHHLPLVQFVPVSDSVFLATASAALLQSLTTAMFMTEG